MSFVDVATEQPIATENNHAPRLLAQTCIF